MKHGIKWRSLSRRIDRKERKLIELISYGLSHWNHHRLEMQIQRLKRRRARL